MKKNKILAFLLIVMIFSCSSKKNILYVQDLKKDTNYNYNYKEITVKPSHILKISVKTENPENLLSISPNDGERNINQNRESLIFKGYAVDSNGYINYPQIGNVLVEGYSIKQISKMLSDILTEREILINPTIDVKILNLTFSVLGEVNNPGKYFYDESNLNILQALGMAGDLTINGKRDEIKLIRENNGIKKVLNVDLTKSSFLIEDSFQIFSGDIIIVNPNLNRVKNAGIIGNSGTLLSLLSFILSSIIVTR